VGVTLVDHRHQFALGVKGEPLDNGSGVTQCLRIDLVCACRMPQRQIQQQGEVLLWLDPFHAHLVLGEGPGLIGGNHGHRS
jgi:hypothetical protein